MNYCVENPSEKYAKVLEREGLDGIRFTVKIIEVNSHGVAKFVNSLEQTYATEKYDAVILMGVAGDSSDFRIELLAKSIRASLGDPDDEDGIPRLLTTLNMSRTKWLPYTGLYSFDAGSYYCNQLYHDVLSLVYGRNWAVGDTYLPAVFLHVPPEEKMSINEGIHRLKGIIKTVIETSCS